MWRLEARTLSCTCDLPFAVIIIIGIIVAVATPQGPIRDPAAIMLGTRNSNGETCAEHHLMCNKTTPKCDKTGTANPCEVSSVLLQPGCLHGLLSLGLQLQASTFLRGRNAGALPVTSLTGFCQTGFCRGSVNSWELGGCSGSYLWIAFL